MKTPMLDKINSISNESQKIGEFIDWLKQSKGLSLCVQHLHGDYCYRPHQHGKDSCYAADIMGRKCERKMEICCGFRDGEYVPTYVSIEKLLASFFDIDLDKAEGERRALLGEIRSAHARANK